MSRDDERGAIAAATYFLVDLYAYTEAAQDTETWTAMSHPECVFCQSTADEVEAERLAGRVTVVAPIRINSASAEALNAAVFGVTLEISTGPDEKYTKDGELLGRSIEIDGRGTIFMIRQGSMWLTRGVDLEKQT